MSSKSARRKRQQVTRRPSASVADRAPSAALPPEGLASIPGGLVVAQSRTIATAYAGPIPPPDLLRQYEELDPGRAAKILNVAERQSDHRMDIERKVITSDIRRSWAGLAAAFILSLTTVCIGGYLVYLDHDTAGATIATAGLGSVVGTFIYGTKSQREERVEKAKLMSGKKK